jgi:hypothetical protein
MRALAASLPTGAVHLRLVVLWLLLTSAGGGIAARLASPALDTAPAPDSGAAKLAERPRKPRPAREHVHPLRRHVQTPRDIDSDYEFSPRIDSHSEQASPAIDSIQQPAEPQAHMHRDESSARSTYLRTTSKFTEDALSHLDAKYGRYLGIP